MSMYSRKRGADSRSDRDAQPHKRAFTGFKESCSVNIKVLVLQAVCGKILGKKGATITKLQSDHNVHIALSKYGNIYPGTDYRVCLISGNSPDGVSKALDFVIEAMYEEFEEQRDRIDRNTDKTIKLAIANSTVGMILGKKGSEIQKLKEESGVSWMKFSSLDDSPLPFERLLTAVGTEEAVSTAFKTIVETVSKDRNNGQNLEIDHDPDRYSDRRPDDYSRGGGDFNRARGGREEFSSGRRSPPPSRGGRGDVFSSRDGGDYNRARPSVFSSSSALGGGSGLLGLLGLDMKVSIPDRGIGKPLTSAVIMQLLEHVDDKLIRTSYTPSEFKDIKTSIANLASLGLLSLGLVDEKSNGFDGGAGGSDYGRDSGRGGGGGYSSLYSSEHSYRRDSYRRD